MYSAMYHRHHEADDICCTSDICLSKQCHEGMDSSKGACCLHGWLFDEVCKSYF